MATVTKGRTFVSGEVVTPTKLNTLVDSATVTQIVDADISASAAISDTKLATIATAGKVSGSAITSGNISTSGNITTSGSVSAATFAGAGASFLVPTGAVIPFPINLVPNGWLAANGAAVSRTTYAALFAYLGTTFGAGDGSTTFALPDLRGYFIRGAGTNSDGTASGSFGEKQADELKSHNHTVGDVNVANNGSFGAGGLASYPSGSITRTTSSVGGTETRPRNIPMLYCIKF